jgi:RNA 2',3'-cyclic 3'-phosphodiesterase
VRFTNCQRRVRLFLAINLPPEVRREIDAATAALRDCAPNVAWIAEARLHLTLKFLGEQPESRIPEIQDAMAAVASRHSELAMTLGGVGAFPNFRRARIVWLGVEQDPRLELLHHDLEVAYDKLGFEVEGRAFRPHLTLARIKQPLSEEQLRVLSGVAKKTEYRTDFIVRSFDLMHSTLGPSGSTYSTVVSAVLRS